MVEWWFVMPENAANIGLNGVDLKVESTGRHSPVLLPYCRAT
jgi:hypothetical protein